MAWNSRHHGAFLAAVAIGVLVIGLGARSKRQIVEGECRPVHGADVCT